MASWHACARCTAAFHCKPNGYFLHCCVASTDARAATAIQRVSLQLHSKPQQARTRTSIRVLVWQLAGLQTVPCLRGGARQ